MSAFEDPRVARRSNAPVLVLAGLQAYDAVTSAVPVAYVKDCLDDVGLPQSVRWAIPVAKTASVIGLVGGLRFSALGRAASVGLTTYFVLAVSAHIRARDFGRNFAAANVMLVTVVAVTRRFWTDPAASRWGTRYRNYAYISRSNIRIPMIVRRGSSSGQAGRGQVVMGG